MKSEEKIKLEKLDLPFTDPDDRVEFIKVSCPSCDSMVPAEHIDLNSKIGKCSNCQALFSVEKDLQHLQTNVKMREKLKRPAGVEIFQFKDELEIEVVQPLSVLQIINLLLSPFVLIFSILIYFLKGEPGAMGFIIASVLLTAYGIYYLFRRKEHKIFINIDEDKVSVQRRPNNWTKDQFFNRSEIEQVYVMQAADGLALCFVIDGIEGQKHVKVLTRMTNISEAKYMEQEIERYLGITDRVVSGEL